MYCRARTAPCTLIDQCRELLHTAVLPRHCIRAESHASSTTGTRARNSEPALGRVSADAHAIAGGGPPSVGRGQDRDNRLPSCAESGQRRESSSYPRNTRTPARPGFCVFSGAIARRFDAYEVCAPSQEKVGLLHPGRYARAFLSSFAIGNTAPRIVPALTRWPSPAPWPTPRAICLPCRRSDSSQCRRRSRFPAPRAALGLRHHR